MPPPGPIATDGFEDSVAAINLEWSKVEALHATKSSAPKTAPKAPGKNIKNDDTTHTNIQL